MTDHPRNSAREYRVRLREAHRASGLLGESAIDRAELIFNLSRLTNRLGQDFETLHHPNGLSWSGFRILNVLWTLGASELRDIARLSGASRASIWSTLKTLERDGLIDRTKSEEDKRLVLVSLTKTGLEVFDRSIAAQVDREGQWFSVLSDADLTALRSLLERLADQHLLPVRDTDAAGAE